MKIIDKRYIYEMAVYHGALKEWHILNLSSGTFYGTSYETIEECEKNIDDGEVRAGMIVKRVNITDVNLALNKEFY